MPSYAEVQRINSIVLGDNNASPMNKKHGQEVEVDIQDQAAINRERIGSASSALTEKRNTSGTRNTERIIKDQDNIEKFFKEKHDALNSIINNKSHAANESKDAITERIIHTVNMMKEVLQSNMSLRETNQRYQDEIDNLNSLLF